jgi:hypothetical protein
VQPGSQDLLTASDAAGLDLVKEVLARFGRVRVRAQGLSMVPAIRPGDILEIERTSIDSLSPARVVVFGCGDRLVAHRIVSHRSGLTTRGDAHWRCDPPLDPSDVLGIVTALLRHDRARPVPRSAGLLRSVAWSVMMRVRHAAARLAGLTPSQRARRAAAAQ